jgi:hypothetical protein
MPDYWFELVLGTDLSTWMLFGVKATSGSEKVSVHHLIRMQIYFCCVCVALYVHS